MTYVAVALLLILGFLGAIQLIAARKPEAKTLADKLAPYQGWIGAVGFVLGAVYLVRMLLHGWFTVLGVAPIAAITSLVAALLLIALGALFGISLVKRSGPAAEKFEALVARIRPLQGTLGATALGVGTWLLLQNLFGIVI